MDRHYSWEDQDYEEMQEWQEFQGERNTFEDYESVDDELPTQTEEGEDDFDESS